MKKRILIYCEGISEKNYISNLFRIEEIGDNYCNDFKINNDLSNAINHYKKSQNYFRKEYNLVVYIYDADIIATKKTQRKNFSNDRSIFLTNKKLEDFLDLHNLKNYYKDTKPHFKRTFLQKIACGYNQNSFEKMDNNQIKYDGFDTILDFILKLFKKEI